MDTGNFQMKLKALDTRRKRLGMSRVVVARRSGVPLTTVQRILSGRESRPSLPSVLSIAEVLGASWDVDVNKGVEEIRERQARQKAERLVGMVQATSGLEGQAVDKDTLRQMVDRTVHELLAGSRLRLWGD